MSWPDLFSAQQTLIVVATATIREAERLIESCEFCNFEGADTPFDWILDRVTRLDGKVTDYIIEVPANCPKCRHEILEQTFVEATD